MDTSVKESPGNFCDSTQCRIPIKYCRSTHFVKRKIMSSEFSEIRTYFGMTLFRRLNKFPFRLSADTTEENVIRDKY